MSLATVKLTSLPLMEAFYTIQGEGAFTGTAAYFIRLGGCDVGCHWCDVKESWEAAKHPNTSIEDIIAPTGKCGEKVVVITGGEPLMYDLTELTQSLRSKGLRTHVETSGAYPLSGDWNWICFSPKKFKAPLAEYYAASHELKVIIFNKSDFKWAEEHAQRMHPEAQLFLQPEWSKANEITPLIVEYVKQNPHWRISLQTHKYLDIP
jgi:organic radical activating enzyme